MVQKILIFVMYSIAFLIVQGCSLNAGNGNLFHRNFLWETDLRDNEETNQRFTEISSNLYFELKKFKGSAPTDGEYFTVLREYYPKLDKFLDIERSDIAKEKTSTRDFIFYLNFKEWKKKNDEAQLQEQQKQDEIRQKAEIEKKKADLERHQQDVKIMLSKKGTRVCNLIQQGNWRGFTQYGFVEDFTTEKAKIRVVGLIDRLGRVVSIAFKESTIWEYPDYWYVCE